jgi:hypothetical protein
LRAIIPALLLLTPGFLTAAEEEPVAEPASRAIPAISLLPEGSILKGVMLPRYDSDRKLVGLLKAERMTLKTASHILGETVVMELFNPDRTSRGRIDLATADFFQDKGLVQTKNPISIVSDRVRAEGAGLVYDLHHSKGFIIGPATTRISQPSPTAMNSASPALRATALLGASFLPLIAAPPALPSAAEMAKLEQDAVPKAPEAAAANKETRDKLRSTIDASEKANKDTLAFLEQADLLAAAENSTVPAEAKPLDIKPAANQTVITSDGGFYFDTVGGVFVYLKNVRVNDPRFELSGADELKIFFDKKEAKAATPDGTAAKPKGKDSLSLGSGAIGDPTKVVATGVIKLVQKTPGTGKEPIQASGARMSFDLATGDKIITGGFPWFLQGSSYARAKEANAIIRIDKDMNVVTQGNWEFGVPLEKKR